MRKRSINHLFDTFMWYLLYLLPLFAFLILLFKCGSPITLTDAMSNCGFGVLLDSQIYVTLSSLFGVGGILPFFASTDLLLYFTYFVCVLIVHLAVDVLLFIPRYAHHLMSCFGGKND